MASGYASSTAQYQYQSTNLACASCKQANIRCQPSTQAPTVGCSRCLRKGWTCQYLNIDTTSSYPYPSTQYTHSQPSNYHQYSHAPIETTYYPNPPSPLPYTGPPPTNSRPRYSGPGNAYPDLSLAPPPISAAFPSAYTSPAAAASHATAIANSKPRPDPRPDSSAVTKSGYPHWGYKG